MAECEALAMLRSECKEQSSGVDWCGVPLGVSMLGKSAHVDI